MISLKQINQQYVRAIPIPDEDKRPILGFDICEEIYSNIFVCAKKKSGKTSALFKIIKECSGRKTIIIVFCSTIYKDKNWIQIRKYFEKKKMDIRVFTSIFEDGEDQINKLINELNEEAKQNEEDKEDEQVEEEPINKCDDILDRLANMQQSVTFPSNEEDKGNTKKRNPKKSKYQTPEYIIIFDDLSSELKSQSLLTLLKKNRHFKTKLIISSQWIHDMLPESRKQVDLFLVFRGFTEKKLMEIYKDCDSGLPFETFCKIYKKATKKPFSFLYIDTLSDSYRRNFHEQFIFNETKDGDEK